MKKQLTQLFAGFSLNAILISSFSVLLHPSALHAQVPNYVPSNGLVGWWPFNGNANDESGNGNNGTVNGATLTVDRFGNANKAYSFDGVSNYINCGPLSAIPNTVGDITQSAWILAPIDQTTFCKLPIMSKRQVITEGWPSIGAGVNSTNKAYFFLNAQNYSAGVNNMMYSGNLTNDGVWHLVTGTKSGNTYKFYFDGVLQSTQTDAFQLTSNSNLIIGYEAMWGFNCERWYSGKLDDIGIWNRALTACEIQDLYNAELNSVNTSAGSDQTICKGETAVLTGSGAVSYVWNNNVIDGQAFVPTSTAEYIVTGTDANGCIGTDTVIVQVNDGTSSTQTQTALDSYTWPVNGQTYTQSGQYTDTLTNAAGCDSIITLDLTLSFTGIEDLYLHGTKKLIKITDFNGKETPFRKNTVLLFIYEDGTVERVYEGE